MDEPVARDQHEHIADAYAQHREHVLRICTAILRDPDEAQDAVQEVFGRLLRQPPDGVRDMRRWLAEVARNHCLDRLRQSGRRPVLPLTEAREVHQEGTPESVAVARGHLAAILAQLDPRQRSALVRSALLDHPLDRIAADMGISYGAAGQLLWRARHQAVRIAQALGAILAGLGGTRVLQQIRDHLRLRPRRGEGSGALREALAPERLPVALPAIIAVALLVSPSAPASGPAGLSPLKHLPEQVQAAAPDPTGGAPNKLASVTVKEPPGAHIALPAGGPTFTASPPSPPTPPPTKHWPVPTAVPSMAPWYLSISRPGVDLPGVPLSIPRF